MMCQSEREELIEEDSSQPGKILPGGDALESDANGIPLHPEKLTSLKLQAANLPTYPSITFSFPDKALKIWKTPPGQTPNASDRIDPDTEYSPPAIGEHLSIQSMGIASGLVRIRIECAGAEDEVLVNLLPTEVRDNAFATGVDDVSRTADPSSVGYQADTWIMAPSGTVPASAGGAVGPCSNDTRFLFSLPANLQLGIAESAPGLFTATPSSVPAQGRPGNPATWPTVSWHGTAAASSDENGTTPVWSITPAQNTPNPVTLPIKVKVMKNRTVKVYLVDLMRADGMRRELDANLIPTEEAIEDHLNDVFAKQINAWFDVEIVRDKDPQTQEDVNFFADQRTDGDISFNIPSLSSFSVDQQQVLNKTGPVGDSDIRVFMISTISIANQGYGLTNRSSATCWVAGQKTSVKYEAPEDVLSTIGHEIGHVLVDYGHPDDVADPGHAPLNGTNRRVRLMCSGTNRDRQNGKLLVKREWDAAESWLNTHIKEEQQ